MTLKERFELPIDAHNKINNYVAKKCEKIADEFAIEFAEWLRNNWYDTGEKWHREPDEDYTSKELLEIYKKEKGL